MAAAATTLNEHFCLCGQCGGDLSLQAQKQSTAVARYLVCAACSLSLSLPVKGALTPLAESCPVCHFQLVQVGAEGEGFVRMNIAAPRASVLAALERIADAFEK